MPKLIVMVPVKI